MGGISSTHGSCVCVHVHARKAPQRFWPPSMLSYLKSLQRGDFAARQQGNQALLRCEDHPFPQVSSMAKV